MSDILDRYRQTIKEEEALRMSNSNFATVKKMKADAPNIMRIADPSSAVSYLEAWMVCDDGEKRPFIIENDHQGKGILSQVLGDRLNFYHGGILSSRKDDNGNKYYEFEQADPELLLQVAYNNDRSNNNGSWKPTRRFGFSIIDREPETEGDMVGRLWCVENQHMKKVILGTQAFEHLIDVRDNNGPLDAYDVNITKTGKGKLNTKYNAQKAGDVLPNVIFGDLTDEEKNYERYDLKQEAALSSATEIIQYLQNTIARIDRVLGTNYLQLLQDQALMENPEGTTDQQQAPAQPATAQPATAQPATAQPAPAQPAPVQQAPVGRQAVQTQVAPQAAPSQAPPQPEQPVAAQVAPQAQPQAAPQVATATQPPPQEPVVPAQPQQAVPAQAQTQTPAPAQAQTPVSTGAITCPICKQPTEIVNEKNCSKCSGVIMEPCDQCKTPFLITQNTCPSCGKVYQIVNN